MRVARIFVGIPFWSSTVINLHAFHRNTWGPRTGMRQMVQSRYSFGYVFNFCPCYFSYSLQVTLASLYLLSSIWLASVASISLTAYSVDKHSPVSLIVWAGSAHMSSSWRPIFLRGFHISVGIIIIYIIALLVRLSRDPYNLLSSQFHNSRSPSWVTEYSTGNWHSPFIAILVHHFQVRTYFVVPSSYRIPGCTGRRRQAFI
jgi:hypothetical protein